MVNLLYGEVAESQLCRIVNSTNHNLPNHDESKNNISYFVTGVADFVTKYTAVEIVSWLYL